MWLDIKNTVWERVHFETVEEMNEVIKKLKSGELTTGNDVCEFLDRSTEWIDDTSEEMRVEENDGYSTMDIMEDNKTIWENSKS
jgi:hypothetical protein